MRRVSSLARRFCKREADLGGKLVEQTEQTPVTGQLCENALREKKKKNPATVCQEQEAKPEPVDKTRSPISLKDLRCGPNGSAYKQPADKNVPATRYNNTRS